MSKAPPQQTRLAGPQEFHVGDHVLDRDDPDATMLVVSLPGLSAEEYEVNPGGKTIAEYNPEYPASDAVIEIVYPSRTDKTLSSLERYAYPVSRLELAEPIHERENGTENDSQ